MVFRPAGHLDKNSDLGLGPGHLCFSFLRPPQDGEIPHASASGKRQRGAALAQARGTGICGHRSLKVGPFPGWQLVGWQLESGGRLGAAGRADGVGNGDQAAPGQSPLCQHPRVLALLTNGPRFLSLICGVACNNKTLLKAGTWRERQLSQVLMRIINCI